MITQPIVESILTRLFGNTRPEANSVNDRGRLPDGLPMEHMLLQLKRPQAQEQALTKLIDQLHDPRSANYHRWLTPNQFGTQFGPAASDIQKITGWLQAHGFRVDVVYPSGMVIGFSGTAGQVRTAFHTEIHRLLVDGVAHIGNMNDPQIPAAFAPIVVGIVSLHDFFPRAFVPSAAYSFNSSCNSGRLLMVTCYQVAPADLATIYNFNPVFNGGNTGQNQTIYLIENSNLYADTDWTTFRSLFGLSGYSGASLTTIHPAPPSGTNNCTDPGVTGNPGEATLDAEWSSAAAPSAAIVMATCANTSSTSGLLIAIQNLINGPNPPAIFSLSYLACEPYHGAAGNAAYNAIYQQGVAEGTSIFVSAGDQGAAQCDYQTTDVTHGIAVNALASTPYNVAVGGTDFGDVYAGTSSTYWNSTNTSTYGSAKSYIPEIPWNNTCASQLIATYEDFAATFGSNGFCNSATAAYLLEPWAGGGGPSGCATGVPTISGVVSGTCAGYAKPSWQAGVVGIPNDGVRDLPDVSLHAANGPWGHTYGFCYTGSGVSCTNGSGAPIQGAAGTSASSPIMAGVQALVNNNAGGPQGNPNYRYYALAATEYGVSGSSTCDSSLGNAVGSACIFYDVTLGDIDTVCTGSYNCYIPSGTYGVLSTSGSSYLPAYPATTGWDFATGIGTVNVYNLVTNWSGAPALQVTPNTNIAASGTQGGPFSPSSFGYTVSASSGSVNFSISGVPNWLTPNLSTGNASSGTTVTFTVNTNANSLAANTYMATITFTNTDTGQGTQTRTATLTVNAVAPPALVVSPATDMVAAGNQGGPFTPSAFQYQVSASGGSINYSISGLPSWLSASPTSGTVSTGTTVTFTVNSNANSLAASTYNATITFTNTGTGQGTQTRRATITVNPLGLTVTPSTGIAASGQQGGPFSPTSFSYSLRAASGSVKYTITNLPKWLTASPTSGIVTTRATSVSFRINTSVAHKLSVGTNIGNINFNDTTNNQVATRVAALAVTPKDYMIKVSASPIADGMVTGGGMFAGGTSDTVTAAPKSGHTFLHWTENGRVVSTSESYTFTVSANITLVADFK
jgi:subtilase family serine protease